PNGSITTLSNRTLGWSAAVFDIAVAYEEDTDRVAELMQQVGDSLAADPAYTLKVLAPFELLGVDAFHDTAVVIKARLKTRPGDQWEIGREYRRRLKKAFEANQVEFPMPHRTVSWGAEPLDVRVHSS
ncbi:MAG TPA: mechanosensitive ion channel family protein, partial [Candidatus Krumholzibacteria bacterium]|nr:mechanosensitive ion channel family protein [Candidatus Krumholzibacteria bacterium]